MKTVKTKIDDYLYEFYKEVGDNASGINPEKVMADALFKLAGELPLNAMDEKIRRKTPTRDA